MPFSPMFISPCPTPLIFCKPMEPRKSPESAGMTSENPPPCSHRPTFLGSSFSSPADMPDELLEPALAASRNHREAERRRRERIKFHLDRLRSLLSCDARIDKASLLAKAVDYVRDLKKHAAEIGGADSFPTEADEVAVDPVDIPTAAGRRHILMASLCCDDRSGLLPELAETLKSHRLKILRAEIATVGGRVRNVLAVVGEDGGGDAASAGGGPAAFLEESLRAMVDRGIPEDRPKRRRVSGRRTATV